MSRQQLSLEDALSSKASIFTRHPTSFNHKAEEDQISHAKRVSLHPLALLGLTNGRWQLQMEGRMGDEDDMPSIFLGVSALFGFIVKDQIEIHQAMDLLYSSESKTLDFEYLREICDKHKQVFPRHSCMGIAFFCAQEQYEHTVSKFYTDIIASNALQEGLILTLNTKAMSSKAVLSVAVQASVFAVSSQLDHKQYSDLDTLEISVQPCSLGRLVTEQVKNEAHVLGTDSNSSGNQENESQEIPLSPTTDLTPKNQPVVDPQMKLGYALNLLADVGGMNGFSLTRLMKPERDALDQLSIVLSDLLTFLTAHGENTSGAETSPKTKKILQKIGYLAHLRQRQAQEAPSGLLNEALDKKTHEALMAIFVAQQSRLDATMAQKKKN